MGFLPISIGIMLLYDFPIALSHPGSTEPYAVLDIFPNVLGFVLILFGLIRLSKKGTACKPEMVYALCMTLFSGFVFTKDVFLYRFFYSAEGQESTAGRCVTFVQHLLILGFVALLFRKTASVLSELDETALSRLHKRVPLFVAMDAVIFLLAFLLSLFNISGMETVSRVAQILHMLLWIFIVWFGGVNQLRAALKVN